MPNIETGITDKGDLWVITPYHPEIVETFRRLMGRWGVLETKGGDRQAWFLRAEHRDRVQTLAARIWPPEHEKVERIYHYDAGGKMLPGAPELDRIGLMRYGRVTHPDVVEVIEDSLVFSGGRRDLAVGGTITIRCRVRVDATAKWPGGTVEELALATGGASVPDAFRDAFGS